MLPAADESQGPRHCVIAPFQFCRLVAGPAAARRRLLLVRASFATDRMIGRRSIRMICAGRPAPRRVPRSRGLTVVAAPANTDYTIRLENVGTGLAHGDRGGQELTGRDMIACLARSYRHYV